MATGKFIRVNDSIINLELFSVSLVVGAGLVFEGIRANQRLQVYYPTFEQAIRAFESIITLLNVNERFESN